MHAFAGQAACIVDAQGRFVNVSPSLAAFFQRDDLPGQSLLDLLEGGDQVGGLLPVAQPYSFQVRIRSPQGPQWATLRLLPGGSGPAGRLAVVVIEPPS